MRRDTPASDAEDPAANGATPTEIRAAVLADVRSISGGHVVFQMVERVGEVGVLAHQLMDPADEAWRRVTDFDGKPIWPFMSTFQLGELPLNRFGPLQAAMGGDNHLVEDVWRPLGIHAIHLMIAHGGGRLLGYVAIVQANGVPALTDAQLAALDGRAPEYSASIARARELELAVDDNGVVLLDHDGAPVDWDAAGGVLLADPALRRLLGAMTRPGPERRAVCFRHGREIRVTELTGPSAAAFSALLIPTRPVPLNDLLLMSPAKMQIVELAAAGATSAEIARMLGRSAHTVRTHLKQIYKYLGVASRVELASHFREIAWSRPPGGNSS